MESDRRLGSADERGQRVRLVVDGAVVPAFAGESVAAALLSAGRRGLRVTPRHAEPRGMYCGIGQCFECVLTVDGERVRACMTPVRDGMRVGGPR
jgi:predicted molibdopterin-dependent oxidoreductase YjgC